MKVVFVFVSVFTTPQAIVNRQTVNLILCSVQRQWCSTQTYAKLALLWTVLDW